MYIHRKLYVLIPAHNEEAQIKETIESLMSQTRQPDEITVILDNCTDNTAKVAGEFPRVKLFETKDNRKKKAGGLNQWLDQNLFELPDSDLILVMDADSTLDQNFLENAIEKIEQGYSACGGVFRGKPGGGIVGMFQRNEYARYERDIERKDGKTLVLTGTATVFLVGPLKEVVEKRREGKINCIDGEAHVYDTGALTEDNELTFALLHLGHMIIAPVSCGLATEVMPTWRQLWHQRRRWKRGAIENNLQYGLTKVTAKYWGLQVWGFLGIMATLIYLFTLVYALATNSFHLKLLWLIVTLVYVVERCVTVSRRGPLQVLIAGTLVVEMFYDISLQVVHLLAFSDVLRRAKKNW